MEGLLGLGLNNEFLTSKSALKKNGKTNVQFFPKEIIKLEYLCSAVVCLGVLMVLGVDGQAEEGNTVGAIPGQAGRDYPNFQVFFLFL